MSTPTADNQGWIPTGAHFGARLALVRQHVGWGNVTEAALARGAQGDPGVGVRGRRPGSAATDTDHVAAGPIRWPAPR